MKILPVLKYVAEVVTGHDRVREMYKKDWDAVLAERNTPAAKTAKEAKEKAYAQRIEDHGQCMQRLDALHAHMQDLHNRNVPH